jgi:hypothetical protein
MSNGIGGGAFGLAMIALLAGCGESENSVQKGFEDGFKAEFAESFGQSCSSGAIGKGVPADAAIAICKCTTDRLAEEKSVTELMKLSPEDALPIMEDCAAKAGLVQ